MVLICTEILLCACCIVCSTIVLRVHEHPPIVPIPEWTRQFFLLKVARRLRINVTNEIIEAEECFDEKSHNSIIHSESTKVTLVEVKTQQKETNFNNHSQTSVQDDDDRYKNSIFEYLKLKKRHYRAVERKEVYEAQWRDLARVIDALFFIVWTVIFVIAHLILFLFLYGNIPTSNQNAVESGPFALE